MAPLPACVSLIGCLFHLAVIPPLLGGQNRLAAIVLVAASLFDMLDGWLARRLHQVTSGGAILDSTLDRVSEGIVFGALAYRFARQDELTLLALTLAAWLGAFLTSYARARAEAFLPRCQVGYLERPERIGMLTIGLLAGPVAPALVIMAILGSVTAAQRVLFAAWSTGHSPPLANTPLPVLVRWGCWAHPRFSGPYWALTAIVLCLLFLTK